MMSGSGGAPQLDERPWKVETIEVCNDCGGLVGWEYLRDGCCFGGMACKREKGTRFVAVPAYLAASPGAGGLDLTDDEARALLDALDRGLTGSYDRLATAADADFVSARSKLRARLDRKDDA